MRCRTARACRIGTNAILGMGGRLPIGGISTRCKAATRFRSSHPRNAPSSIRSVKPKMSSQSRKPTGMRIQSNRPRITNNTSWAIHSAPPDRRARLAAGAAPSCASTLTPPAYPVSSSRRRRLSTSGHLRREAVAEGTALGRVDRHGCGTASRCWRARSRGALPARRDSHKTRPDTIRT